MCLRCCKHNLCNFLLKLSNSMLLSRNSFFLSKMQICSKYWQQKSNIGRNDFEIELDIVTAYKRLPHENLKNRMLTVYHGWYFKYGHVEKQLLCAFQKCSSLCFPNYSVVSTLRWFPGRLYQNSIFNDHLA